MDDIRILFVLSENCKDESEMSDIMLQAFESCKENVNKVEWIQENNLKNSKLFKTDFVIFQDFKGENFENLKESKCARILGPWCVSICLIEGRPIPNFPWPIYNIAMVDCVVSCSHLPKNQKIDIKEKVQLMGGCYTDCLTSTNTHLVTDTVKSEKYMQAAESGSCLMLSEWIDDIWKLSQSNNIHANDEQFTKYRVLPFHNLTVCSTGLNREQRQEITSMVTKNGGIFTGSLNLANTDILVVHGSAGTNSEKYKAARNTSNIQCVTIDWISNSILKGYALPYNNYNVKKITSTPTKQQIDPNFSTLSAIAGPVAFKSTLEETTTQSPAPCSSRISPNKRPSSELCKLIDGLDIKKAKKAGQFLDGCSVYLAGFDSDQKEKLCKILNLSGATRYDDLSERITHIIIGDQSSIEVKMIKLKNNRSTLVSINWLIDCIEKQHIIDEEDYLINLHNSEKENFSSPLGKKGLSLLRSKKVLTAIDIDSASALTNTEDTEQEPENLILQHYFNSQPDNHETDTLVNMLKDADTNFNNFNKNTEDVTNKDDLSQASNTDLTNQIDVFDNLRFVLMNFDVNYLEFLQDQIENVGGIVMPKSFNGIPDYIVTAKFLKTGIQHTANHIINDLWLLESIQNEKLCDFQYYHYPYIMKNEKPLENCVVVISGYTSFQRKFLMEFINELGGIAQEQLARISKPEKNILPSTHLISAEANGKKYEAALKWGLPVIDKQWLIECSRTGIKVDEDNFTVGNVNHRTSITTPSRLLSVIPASTTKENINSPHNTPTTSKELSKHYSQINHNENNDKCTPISEGITSQITPVNKIIKEFKQNYQIGTPAQSSPSTPGTKCWYNIDTPELPLGAFLRPNPSPDLRKRIQRFINQFPDYVSPKPTRRDSTPLSELKRRLYQKLTADVVLNNENENNIETTNVEVNAGCSKHNQQEGISMNLLKQFEELESLATNNVDEFKRKSRGFQATLTENTNNEHKESQPLTVGWDFQDDPISTEQPSRIFILSGIENNLRQSFVKKLENLGGTVSDLQNYDPSCTHLLCPKPARNEKTLACMAAGKWILHISYIDKCIEAGRFLNEEEFEFGNPLCLDNLKLNVDDEMENRIKSMYWWRKEISRRGYCAFNDMRAIVVANKREPIVRVIEAGGGVVIDIKPPFHDDNIHATHCLLEPRNISDFSVFIPLAEQGIYCVNTLYISDFLHRTNKDIRDCILPHFIKYYAKK